MLHSISWSQYFLTISLATAFYYLFIWLALFKGRLSFVTAHRFQSIGEDEPDEVMSTSQHVMNELRPLFNQRKDKAELLTAIQSVLSKYKEWDEPSFRLPLTDFIVQEFASKCSIRLGEEDQRALW